MNSRGNKFILEKFLQKAQDGKIVPGGKDIKIQYPDGTIKVINTGSPEYREMYEKGQIQTPEGIANDTYFGGVLDDVEIKRKLSEFGKYRNAQKKLNSWEDFANQRFLGNFERNMGQTINNLPEYRKQEYEDYIDALAFDEYIKKHQPKKNESRGEYIDRIQKLNADSPSFQRAFQANAEYNANTDQNNWRKGLVGLGTITLGPVAMNKLKQNSDYYSSEEKKDFKEHPIKDAFSSTLETFAPLEIPGNMLYGTNNTWDEALSGRGTNVPTEARILGDPLMLIGEAAPALLKRGSGFINNIVKSGKNVFRPVREADLSAIENIVTQTFEATPEAIEAARRAFHNSERFLTPEEFAMLRTHGRGAAEDYRASTIRPADMLPNPPDELIMNPETGNLDPVNFTYSVDEALERLRSGQDLEPGHLNVLGDQYNSNNLTLADSDLFGRYVIRNNGRNTTGANASYMGTEGRPSSLYDTWGTGNWNPNNERRVYQIDDPYAPSDPTWNTPTYVVRNKSGFRKEDVIRGLDDAEKEVIQNMPDEEFAKTVTKPSGKTVPYVEGINVPQMTYNTEHNRMIHSGATAMTPEEYAQIFNDNIDRLNEIIRLNNKSGVEYKVEKLFPNGQLRFSTPEQTLRVPVRSKVRAKVTDISSDPSAPYPYQVEYSTGPEHMDVEFFDTQAKAEKFMNDLKANEPEFADVKIDAGTTQWDTPINAGRWEGEVEDIDNIDYFKSIPGLNMSMTSSSVFADRMPRIGTGTYKSLNEFLKELNLGRVKPGFNLQTPYSFNAWDKAAKKGQAVGYYGGSELFYGAMKKYGGDNISDFEKYAMKEMGGMLYANKDAGLSHEQSMNKYLSERNNLLDFMKRIKVVGGPVPFDEYYRENIIIPRNKS